MKYLVAVSGGLDSVVLLDQMVRLGGRELIVAHFDHGIRLDSADDARFVQGLSEQYGLAFECRREELGPAASEELARNRRYAFLRQMAVKHEAVILTAHHADDVVETVAINLRRGTGWRGLAVLNSPGLSRPLLPYSKRDILAYALARRLEWVEDSTNGQLVYLRNQLRHCINLTMSEPSKQMISRLRQKQVAVKRQIEAEATRIIGDTNTYARYLFMNVDAVVACELLQSAIVRTVKTGATRPQLRRALLMIKTARPGSTHHVGDGVELRFTLRTFIIETTR